ncbi:GPW/gp25 family protein [Chitinimonas koreensis]|uniref:GPW/gp25 family protein n=1 Tax=Chitinimonas koreensis TaxID=356302 RepID=UPI00040D4D69|nr:GPW/gp25 family protein [Chitinimonas koreensis]QNM96390.1 GPW/gp25 family protein [Chitinimonas koreensis]
MAAYLGMHASTGRSLADDDHIAQSVADILTTPVGSRLMRREYGSQLFDLIDQPANGATAIRLNAAAVMALMRWEPRIRLSRVAITLGSQAGAVDVAIEYSRRDGLSAGEPRSLALTLRGRP